MRFLLAATTVALLLGCAGILGDTGAGTGSTQDETCAQYLDCLAEVDPTTLASVQSTYGESGSCWTSEATSAQCATACETALDQELSLYPHEEACGGDGSTTANDIDGDWSFEADDTEGDCADQGLDLTLATDILTFSAEADDAFSVSGSATLGTPDQAFDFSLSFDCAYEDDAFTCDEFSGDYDTAWTFFGDYDGEGLDATMEIGIGDGSGSVVCTAEVPLTGSRE
jgi:hypothetical protein